MHIAPLTHNIHVSLSHGCHTLAFEIHLTLTYIYPYTYICTSVHTYDTHTLPLSHIDTYDPHTLMSHIDI